MHKLGKTLLFLVGILVGVGMVIGDVSAAEIDSRNNATVGQTELGQELVWSEAGITLSYPDSWQLIGDENFDFVLLGPSDDATGGFTIIALQQNDLTATLQEDMEAIAGDDADGLIEITLGDTEAWRFDTVDEAQHTVLIGFSPAPGRIAVLFMSAPVQDWEASEAIFDGVLDAIEIVPLELDHEMLNEQLQENFVENGELVIGDADAPVLVVEFLDYSCPHCSDYRHSINRLIQDYVVTGRARLNLGILTFVGEEFSVTAANAQFCGAELGIGWDIHELLFEEYEEFGAQEAYTTEHILGALEEAELDVDLDAFETCFTEQTFEDNLDATSSWAGELGVSGTPSVLFGTSEDDLAFITNDAGENITRTVLLFTYEYIDELTAE